MASKPSPISPTATKKSKVKNFAPSTPTYSLDTTAETKFWQDRTKHEEVARNRLEQRLSITTSSEAADTSYHPLSPPSPTRIADPDDPHNQRRIPRALAHIQNEQQNRFLPGRYNHSFLAPDPEAKDMGPQSPPSPSRAAGVPSVRSDPFKQLKSGAPSPPASPTSAQQALPAAGVPSSPPPRPPPVCHSPKVAHDIKGIGMADFAHLGAPEKWDFLQQTSVPTVLPYRVGPAHQESTAEVSARGGRRARLSGELSQHEETKIRMDLVGNDLGNFASLGAPVPWTAHQQFGGQSAIQMRHKGLSPAKQLRKARKAEAQAQALARARYEAQQQATATPPDSRTPAPPSQLDVLSNRPVPTSSSAPATIGGGARRKGTSALLPSLQQ